MARVVDINILDDIDGTPADETVTYGVDGVNYEIDLSAANAKEFRKVLQEYVDHSRRAANRRGGKRAAQARTMPLGVDPSDVRAWAKQNKINVSERGRISAAIVEKYVEANS